jgi:hypothetical protein
VPKDTPEFSHEYVEGPEPVEDVPPVPVPDVDVPPLAVAPPSMQAGGMDASGGLQFMSRSMGSKCWG